MHFSAAAAAAIALMAGSVLATPVAVPSSSVPAVAPAGAILGDTLSEAESAAKDAELAAAGVTVDDSAPAFSAGVADGEGVLGKRSYLGSCGSCSIATVSGEYALECRCYNNGGAIAWTRIVLNRCLANANGQLDWRRNGGFQGSCSSYLLEGNKNFQSKCRNSAGATNWAWAKNLEERIHNWNGVLGCDV